MNYCLKAVVMGIDNVLVSEGEVNFDILDEVITFINFLKRHEITIIILANHANSWTYRSDKETINLKEYFFSKVGEIPWIQAGVDDIPCKQTANCVSNVLAQYKFQANEAIYIGNQDADMQAAVNSKILFCNAQWYSTNNPYGFPFMSLAEIAKFIDVFCIGKHSWYYKMDYPGLKLFSMGPYAKSDWEYCTNALGALKRLEWGKHRKFWLQYLCSNIYFSGIHNEFDYFTFYPGHGNNDCIIADYRRNTLPAEYDIELVTFGKCFRKKYIPDLIHRHTDATKLASARSSGIIIDHLSQLNTIKLMSKIGRIEGEPHEYKTYAKKNQIEGKKVLVIDDICTSGYSFECARNYLLQAGASPVMVSFLKTPKKFYERIDITKKYDPYCINTFLDTDYSIKKILLQDCICDHAAPPLLQDKLNQYRHWSW